MSEAGEQGLGEISVEGEVSGVFGLNDDDDEFDPRFTRGYTKTSTRS